jgi:hypothetical protein
MGSDVKVNWSAIDKARQDVIISTVPDGWFSRADYQNKYNVRRSAACEHLRKLLNSGKLHTKTISNQKGGTIPIYAPVAPVVQLEHEPTRTSRRGDLPKRARRA